jgi:tetratricopeptide (TPR) repeat protein
MRHLLRQRIAGSCYLGIALCLLFSTANSADTIGGNGLNLGNGLDSALEELQASRQVCLSGQSQHSFGTEEEKVRFQMTQEAVLAHISTEEHQRWEKSCIESNFILGNLNEGVNRLRQSAKYDLAVRLNQHLLERYRMIFGSESPAIAERLYNFGQIYSEAGNGDKAEQYYKQALAAYKTSKWLDTEEDFPAKSYGIGMSLLRLAELYEKASKSEYARQVLNQAEQLLTAEITIYTQNNSISHAKQKISVLNELLVQVYRKQHLEDKAKKLEFELEQEALKESPVSAP